MERDDFREAVQNAKEYLTLDGMAMTMCEEMDAASVRAIINGLHRYVKEEEAPYSKKDGYTEVEPNVWIK